MKIKFVYIICLLQQKYLNVKYKVHFLLQLLSVWLIKYLINKHSG
jgi:hypothetical protein